MPTHTRAARTIAALFVVTMLMGMVDAYLAAPVLRGPLGEIHAHATIVLLGALMRLLMSAGVVAIAVAFLPVLARGNRTIALAYLAARTAECVLLCIGGTVHFFLLGLSRSSVAAGTGLDPTVALLAEGALGFSRTSYQMAMTILGLAGSVHAWTLLRARLLPAWIAGMGSVGYALVLLSALLDLVGVVDTLEGLGALMYVPAGLFELFVLPAWLWVRGFSEDAQSDRPVGAQTL